MFAGRPLQPNPINQMGRQQAGQGLESPISLEISTSTRRAWPEKGVVRPLA